ncbi:MAG: hypothetical protein IAF58_13630 [Leptolyngbya sp.]|jgi:hypothetical protein|nr:hypothetical protein [Candidatus Melainabacteria bacterium]
MKTRKFLSAAVLASVCGFGLLATSSLASGPIILGPTTAPKLAPTVTTVPANVQALKLYREVRSFWLSRAIVR